MAEQEEKTEKQEIPVEVEKPKKSSVNPKVFIIGLPLFIIQLAAVYYITANVLLNKMQNNGGVEGPKKENQEQVAEKKHSSEPGKFIYPIDDIIVNPAGTDGKRLLLTSVGFDIESEEEKEEWTAKEVVIKDIIVSELSSKSIDLLNNFAYRDTLKIEISQKLKKTLPELKVNNVYFSKYIIQ